MTRAFFFSAALAAGLATVGCDMPPVGGDDATMSDQAASARDQTPAGSTRQQDSGRVEQFVQQAASGNLAEIELGQLAATRAQNNEVRQFAQRMVQEHTKALDQLRSAVSEASITVPTELSSEHQQTRERLSELQGDEFDREYIDVMVDEHEKMADMLEARRNSAGMQPGAASEANAQLGGGLAPVNTWASQALPIVQEHLELARQIQRRLR
ncbi:MAG TPA: DUF4142 domain-containing protein [Vicinamibacterales bacterium]